MAHSSHIYIFAFHVPDYKQRWSRRRSGACVCVCQQPGSAFPLGSLIHRGAAHVISDKSMKQTQPGPKPSPTPEMDPTQSVKCKIVVVGDSQCGKTALLHVFAKDCFPEVRWDSVRSVFLGTSKFAQERICAFRGHFRNVYF